MSDDSSRNPGKPFVVIMVVNAPGNPRQGRWLELCLRMVSRHTQWPNYRVYVWNNDPEADWLRPFLLADVHATLLDSVPVEGMTAGPASINHALALQQLYERARTDGAEYVVTLDSDAHPLRKGWLTYLLSSLRDDTVLAGVWRDELRDAIDPYLHASCLCTTVEFIEKNGLRFDKIDTAGPARSDTLSSFTDAAINTGAGIHKLRRSNKRQFHRVMGGIYGDVVYHHGAGSRPNISFWGDKEAPATFKENRALWDLATKLLFESYDDYIEYLRGSDSRTRYPTSAGVVLMLGMHRSGTSCLAGCLENAGLNLGAASSNNDNQPRGNRELRQKDLATETMLASNGGNWRNPPSEVTLSDDDRHSILDAVGTLRQREPCGLKDPRVLLMADAWFAMIPDARPIGCFRHPRSVAASLMARDGMSTDEALALWNEYNLKLVALHRERHFPLVEFDLSNYTDYLCSVLDVARSLALNDNPICIGSAVIAEADHHTATQTDVPETCAGTYEYLRNNKFRGNAVERRFVELQLAAPRKWADRDAERLPTGRRRTGVRPGTWASRLLSKMDRAVHLMRRARTGEPKYLFLLCSHNSGSTLLWRILQTSPFVSALPKEGQALEQVREIMMPNRWNEDKQIDWPQVRQTWERIWDMSKPVLLEKSPPHLIRARQLAAHFPNAHFIVTVRNPYAYCEGTRRRWTPEKSYAQIAETWVRHGRHQMANIGNLPRVAALSYEDLVTDQPGARRRLLDFLPDLRWIAVGDSFRVHSIYGDEDLPVVNLNDTQIARLTGQNIDEINAVLYDAPDVMGFFHYEYL